MPYLSLTLFCVLLLTVLFIACVAVCCAHRASASALRSAEIAIEVAADATRHQAERNAALEVIEDRIARGLEILAQGAESADEQRQDRNHYRGGRHGSSNSGNLH